MQYVMIEYDRELRRWAADLEEDIDNFWEMFEEAAVNSKLRWEALDVFQSYQFKLMDMPNPQIEEDPDAYPKMLGLRFLGVDARWGEFVPATKDQMVLGNPA